MLFKEAEEEQALRGDDSELHIIIFDEIDSVCKQRGSSRDGTGVGDSVVNQLLTKIDGVNALNNILLIGMTNRKDLLDEALLRPGRMEVQIEIGLPDEHGRQQILRIKTDSARQNSFMARAGARRQCASAQTRPLSLLFPHPSQTVLLMITSAVPPLPPTQPEPRRRPSRPRDAHEELLRSRD